MFDFIKSLPIKSKIWLVIILLFLIMMSIGGIGRYGGWPGKPFWVH